MMRAPQPDFLRPVQRPGLLAWAWYATGVLVLAVTVLDGLAAWQQRSAALARQIPAARPVGVPAAPVRPEHPARDAEARRWLQQRNLPWPAVWAAAEDAADGVQWLALSHGSTAGLRLTGVAGGIGLAQAAAQALRRQQHQGRAVWQGVALASVERVPEGHRFDLVARLADPAAAAAP